MYVSGEPERARHYWEREQAYLAKGRRDAINFSNIEGEREVLTPAGLGWLYQRGRSTVTMAMSRGALEVPFVLDGTRVIRLASALNHWGRPDPVRLAQIRATGSPLWVTDSGPWLVERPPEEDSQPDAT